MILDISVTIKWLITEEWTDEARALLQERSDLAAPDLIDLEAASTLTRKARQRVINGDEAQRLRFVHELMPMQRFGWRPFELDAFDLSLRLHAVFYDCVYLAAAISRDEILVTADERFVRAARSEPSLQRYVRALSQT